jgi:hypothetical protein
MSGMIPSEPIEQVDALHRVVRVIDRATIVFPISQLVVPLTDALDWLLDDVSTDDQWLEQRASFRQRFIQHWQAVAKRAVDDSPRLVSDRALEDADYDPLHGKEPWGSELTRVCRSALLELGPTGSEATHVLPDTKRMQAFVRTINSQDGKLILPVFSYSPLIDSEWRAILENLDGLIELALAFEGAVIVWLIGGFYRDVEGRLKLSPKLSLPPPQHGTRVKPIRILIGTAYEEQSPSLIPLAHAVRKSESHLSDELLPKTSWHRVVVQLDVGTDDYELFTLSRLSDVEREMVRKVMYFDEEPRRAHVVQGAVEEVPRPWQRPGSVSLPQAVRPPAKDTRILPPKIALEAVDHAPSPPVVDQHAASLSLSAQLLYDAQELRRKGSEAIARDLAIAQKYLLASTVLENTSVDVWLKLIELASSPKQKEAFRREAEKVLRQQRKTQS